MPRACPGPPLTKRCAASRWPCSWHRLSVTPAGRWVYDPPVHASLLEALRLPTLLTLRSIADVMASSSRPRGHLSTTPVGVGSQGLSGISGALWSPTHSPSRPLQCRTHVLVDNRKLLQVLEGQQVNPMAAACSILSDIPLHLDVSL
jgi:hypothetical protein